MHTRSGSENAAAIERETEMGAQLALATAHGAQHGDGCKLPRGGTKRGIR